MANFCFFLVSENKVLCHPSSVDSLSTSAAKEDHVSMGGFSARKALNVVKNVEKGENMFFLCVCMDRKGSLIVLYGRAVLWEPESYVIAYAESLMK